MVTGLIGKKVGMTQVFGADGVVAPVTVIKAGPCVIAQDDTTTIVPDGYAGSVDRFGNLILARGS